LIQFRRRQPPSRRIVRRGKRLARDHQPASLFPAPHLDRTEAAVIGLAVGVERAVVGEAGHRDIALDVHREIGLHQRVVHTGRRRRRAGNDVVLARDLAAFIHQNDGVIEIFLQGLRVAAGRSIGKFLRLALYHGRIVVVRRLRDRNGSGSEQKAGQQRAHDAVPSVIGNRIVAHASRIWMCRT